MITPKQSKMARVALDLDLATVAKMAGVGINTISRFENGMGYQARTVEKLQAALEAAGVEFIPENGGGAGVRLRKVLPVQGAKAMDWLSIRMPASEVPGGLYAAMCGLFQSALTLSGGIPDFAVIEYSPDPGEHVFYFSRQAVLFGGEFLSKHGAVACDAPPLTEQTTLLIGASDALSRLLSSASH